MTTDPLFRLTIQDVFSIRGRGTVVTGTIESGSIRPGDTVSYRRQGAFKPVVVDGIEMYRKQISQAGKGQTVGLLLRSVEPGELQRGDVLLGSEMDFEWKP
jgi:elongation factor Tu